MVSDCVGRDCGPLYVWCVSVCVCMFGFRLLSLEAIVSLPEVQCSWEDGDMTSPLDSLELPREYWSGSFKNR